MKKARKKSTTFLKHGNSIQSLSHLISYFKSAVWHQASFFKTKWKRVLPSGEYFVDRWEKAKFLGFGTGTSIYDSSVVMGTVNVGCNTWIGPFTVLDGSGELCIGDHCSISAGVQIYTHDTVEWATSGGVAGPSRAPVSIGNRCYIGPNTIIAKGVTIGDGCVVGANSFVNIDIPPGHKAWGTPARLIETAK